MKKTLTAALPLLLAACYQDKGNYEYAFGTMNSIDSVWFTPGATEQLEGLTIEFTQPLTEADTLQRVEAHLSQSLAANMDNLDFRWYRQRTADGKTVGDTVTTKGFMDVALDMGRETKYSVLLEVRDNTTGLAHYENIRVATRPIFKNSTFVLHGAQGDRKLGNIEAIGGGTEVRTDAYALAKPGLPNPFAKANKLMYQATMTFTDWTHVRESDNLVAFMDDGTAKVYHPFGLNPKFTNYPNYVTPKSGSGYLVADKIGMRGDPSNQTDYYFIIGRDGKIATARAVICFRLPAKGGETDYSAAHAVFSANHLVFWDAKHSRFLYANSAEDSYQIWYEDEAYHSQLSNPVLNANIDFSTLGEEISPVGKKCIYAFIQYRENIDNEHPMFIFKDEASGKYFLYELSPTGIGGKDGKKAPRRANGKDTDGDGPAYTIEGVELEGFAPGNDALVAYNTWFPTNYLFYADGGNLVRYNSNNGDRVVLYSAPAGYSITCLKFRENNSLAYSGDLGLYLGIGLANGGNGAVAELKLTTGSDLDETHPVSFHDSDADGNHFGPVADIQFVHEYSYYVPTY